MVSVTDVKAQELIERVSKKLQENDKIKPPVWTEFVKTGAHAERPPARKDWWYVRCASILRKLAVNGKTGVGQLRTWYGGRKNRGVKPEHHVDASGNIIRKALQQLEAAGYVKKEKDGRTLSPAGQSLLTKTVLEIKGGKKVERGKQERAGRTSAQSTEGKETPVKKNTKPSSTAKTNKRKTSKP